MDGRLAAEEPFRRLVDFSEAPEAADSLDNLGHLDCPGSPSRTSVEWREFTD